KSARQSPLRACFCAPSLCAWRTPGQPNRTTTAISELGARCPCSRGRPDETQNGRRHPATGSVTATGVPTAANTGGHEILVAVQNRQPRACMHPWLVYEYLRCGKNIDGYNRTSGRTAGVASPSLLIAHPSRSKPGRGGSRATRCGSSGTAVFVAASELAICH